MLYSSGDPNLSNGVLNFFTSGLFDWSGWNRILDRAFDRFVMFGERAVGEHSDRSE